ncbi:MAG: hypothetical protein ACKVP0_23865 [Pirellulaceae bacterium]
MTAGNLSLNFNAPGTFTATVTAPQGYVLGNVMLTSPSGIPYPMINMSGGANPSTWQYVAMVPPGGSVTSGNWTATANLQCMAQCFGTATV